MLCERDLILLSSSLPPHHLKPQEREEWDDGLQNSLLSYQVGPPQPKQNEDLNRDPANVGQAQNCQDN